MNRFHPITTRQEFDDNRFASDQSVIKNGRKENCAMAQAFEFRLF